MQEPWVQKILKEATGYELKGYVNSKTFSFHPMPVKRIKSTVYIWIDVDTEDVEQMAETNGTSKKEAERELAAMHILDIEGKYIEVKDYEQGWITSSPK